jgi:hypothetical protein
MTNFSSIRKVLIILSFTFLSSLVGICSETKISSYCVSAIFDATQKTIDVKADIYFNLNSIYQLIIKLLQNIYAILS